MSSTRYALAVEELAYALGVLGGTDTAIGFLLAILGERPRMETEGRLLAASHALVARGLLDFDMDSGETWLKGGLEKVIGPMITHNYSLRCSKATEAEEEVITFYAGDSRFIKHYLHHGVVSVIEEVPEQDAVKQDLSEFFEIPTNDVVGEPIAVVPKTTIDSIRQGPLSQSESEAQQALIQCGAAESDAAAIIQDLKHSAYRGSIVKLKLEDEQTVSDKGFLLLKGETRGWILVINVDDETTMLSVYPASTAAFQQQLALLMT